MHAVVRCLTCRNPLLLSHQHHQPSASDWIGEAERGCAQRRTAPHPTSAAPIQLYVFKPISFFKLRKQPKPYFFLVSDPLFLGDRKPSIPPRSPVKVELSSRQVAPALEREELLKGRRKTIGAPRSHVSH